MNKPKGLKRGDRVAIVSLSSGILGESFASHQLDLGKERLKSFGLKPLTLPNSLKGMEYLKNHPEARARDLKDAFADDSIAGIFCAIGGDDTYRSLPYLMEDEDFIQNVKNNSKIFSGFSDTTVNHLMFHQLGMESFYGLNILSDLAELEDDMLPYTKETFLSYFAGKELTAVPATQWWYEERQNFSVDSVGTKRTKHNETHGFELLQGEESVSGQLLGGCLESLYECLVGERYADQNDIVQKYNIFPTLEEWKGKIMFLETSEEKASPEKLREMLTVFKDKGIFSVIQGLIVGKPQNEAYYDEYKKVYKEIIADNTLPILYNLPFGHAFPRTLLPYGLKTTIDTDKKTLVFDEPYFVSG
ncbi:carboxypeptidase [Tetragenococcus osmophilus]|uniref:Carboxypeptidase n=1 Tax=Tetragenococcus osmophilus TaxID=526944 RepID=A0AA37XJH1_9ENTE|nr:S66 peptidase family protein [Tetragenococcus osmophilus]AYW47071.1 carboxypeptidase [Tetragenococcus osmophilus]GMA55141.1 LD-carboxypeptidase [Alicyclobacillus contaminans]GMA71086.1 LD-carboxypeptidase [Tetragenococcus osmophilus]